MLRQCLRQGRRRCRYLHSPDHRPSSWSPLSSFLSAEEDDVRAPDLGRWLWTAPPHSASSPLATTRRLRPRHHAAARRRNISRRIDPLVRHGTLNTADDDDDDEEGEGPLLPVPPTADDLELGGDGDGVSGFWGDLGGSGGEGSSYDDIFADPRPVSAEDEKNDEDAEEAARRAAINAELDSRTGRLWDDEWIITDDQWSSPDKFDDLEDWRPGMATRKSLESVRVCAEGVPTLEELAQLHVPKALPQHPGGGDPSKYAAFRRREMTRRLRTAIQLCVHDDVKKILGMESWEEKQQAVDALFEAVEGQVAAREPVLAKLPTFGETVERELEELLSMVHARAQGAEKEKRKRKHEERQAVARSEEATGEAGGKGGEGQGRGRG